MPNITRVKCIATAGWGDIRMGKVYEVVRTTWPAIGKHYILVNDKGIEFMYRAALFTIVVSYRNPPHPHADVIKAWADVAEVQY